MEEDGGLMVSEVCQSVECLTWSFADRDAPIGIPLIEETLDGPLDSGNVSLANPK